MKQFLVVAAFCLALCAYAFPQQADDTPATREDVQKYFEVMHSRDMINKMIDAMTKPMHQMMHEQYLKDKDKLPEDFESRMQKEMDDMLKEMPWQEMIEAEMPAFQKHLTKGDLNAIVAFYSTPTGQKLLREMPEIMAESMEAMMPTLRRYIDRMTNRVQTEVAEMIKQSEKKAIQAPATRN